jgi:hypothetical protein
MTEGTIPTFGCCRIFFRLQAKAPWPDPVFSTSVRAGATPRELGALTVNRQSIGIPYRHPPLIDEPGR